MRLAVCSDTSSCMLWFDCDCPSQVHLLGHLILRWWCFFEVCQPLGHRGSLVEVGFWDVACGVLAGPASSWALCFLLCWAMRNPSDALGYCRFCYDFPVVRTASSDTTGQNSSFPHFSCCFLLNIWLYQEGNSNMHCSDLPHPDRPKAMGQLISSWNLKMVSPNRLLFKWSFQVFCLSDKELTNTEKR